MPSEDKEAIEVLQEASLQGWREAMRKSNLIPMFCVCQAGDAAGPAHILMGACAPRSSRSP